MSRSWRILLPAPAGGDRWCIRCWSRLSQNQCDVSWTFRLQILQAQVLQTTVQATQDLGDAAVATRHWSISSFRHERWTCWNRLQNAQKVGATSLSWPLHASQAAFLNDVCRCLTFGWGLEFNGVALWFWSGSAIIGICKDGARKQRLVFWQSHLHHHSTVSLYI